MWLYIWNQGIVHPNILLYVIEQDIAHLKIPLYVLEEDIVHPKTLPQSRRTRYSTSKDTYNML